MTEEQIQNILNTSSNRELINLKKIITGELSRRRAAVERPISRKGRDVKQTSQRLAQTGKGVLISLIDACVTQTCDVEHSTHLSSCDRRYEYEQQRATPSAACRRCGGWTGHGGMSQYANSAVRVHGRTGCNCNKGVR